MALDTIAGYTFIAEQLCPECTRKRLGFGPGAANPHDDMTVEERLTAIARRIGVDREDEHSFDSDTFPKAILTTQLDCCGALHPECDAHERCASCGTMLCHDTPDPADRSSERVGADDLN